MIIVDGQSHFDCDLYTFYLKSMLPRARKLKISIPTPDNYTSETQVYARVYNNMWIVDCPWCKNAELVWKTTPKFMCTTCWNNAIKNSWCLVYFPYNLEEIEAVLMKRPVPLNRNAYAWELVEQLHQENLDHGIL